MRYVLRKLLETVVSLLLLTVVVFVATQLLGDPTAALLPVDASIEQRAAVRNEMGLDRPAVAQYWSFLGQIARGDLGTSIHTRQPVWTSIRDRAPTSLVLAVSSMVVAIGVAVPLGVLAATRRGSAWDVLARGFAVAGQATPPFWLGLLLILVLSVHFRLLPAGGTGTWRHLVLPTVTLGWFISAGVLRLLRGSMIEVLRSDFVLFARSYGMSRRRVVWAWALPNGLISVVTFIGYMFGVIIAGAIVVEAVFSWPGLGRLAQEAVVARDVPLIQGTVLVLAALMIASNLLVDLTYALIDPRVRVSARPNS